MNSLLELQTILHQAKKPSSESKTNYYKTGPGSYAEHDQFIGVSVPELRKIAKLYQELPLALLQKLIESPINEERLLALFILVNRYQKENEPTKQTLYQFYLDNLKYINNWNLVDSSAHWIIGAHLSATNKNLLFTLAQSNNLWERRIAIVSTWYFIRQGNVDDTIKLAEMLLHDTHDLIHKAVGWMLREVGKREPQILADFLDQYARSMPRTMLRYAIEKLTPATRKAYLLAKSKQSQ